MSWLPGILAHATPINYRFPLPIWVYAVGGGLVVLLSAPAAAAGVGKREWPDWRSRNVYPTLRRLRLGAIGLALATLLALVCLLGGLAALSNSNVEASQFFENPATVLIWVDFWVGLGLVSMLVGNVWDFVSPLSALVRSLDRLLARLEVQNFEYPARLGQWPAVLFLLVWSWLELVWPSAKEPDVLVGLGLFYVFLTAVGVAAWGAEAWLANGELFTVFARTFARVAPLELEPRSPDAWLATEPRERALRFRLYGAGLREGGAAPAGSGAFVVALLATVVFDGFSQTSVYTGDIQGWFFDQISWFGFHVEWLSTLLMLAIVAGFVTVFLAAMMLVGRREGGFRLAAERYSPTLIPIAAVYFAAHYFTYLLFAGQTTLGVVLDPLARGWDPWGLGEYGISVTFLPAVGVWWTQITLIVVGHVAGIFAAHRVALNTQGGAGQALRAQTPVIFLMVAYTMAGLWVLAQQLSPLGS